MIKKNISPEPGLRLRYLRDGLGLSRAEFAEITGMSANTMRSIEVGNLKLTRPKALMYSNMFIYVLELDFSEASVDMLLYGEQRGSQPTKKKIIVRKT
jgi:transcriptional regulator with XRE-family HTH domain